MAFFGQISNKLQEMKTQLPQVIEQANKAKQNFAPVFNKCTQQLDQLGKILQVNVDRKQSPIDILPSLTAFDPSLEAGIIKVNYDDTCQTTIINTGTCVMVKYPEGNSIDLEVSFIPDEQYHLDRINFHWGTEPMNGSEHTVGGVGYAGEVHFIHRNLKYPTMEAALKAPNGVVAIAVFLNESHDDNMSLVTLTKVLSNVLYNGSESGLNSFRASQMIPSNDYTYAHKKARNLEKSKEFWIYEGSETIEPYRKIVKWIIFRSAIPISSIQLEAFRELRSSRPEDEVEERMVSIRPLQSPNSRIIRSSFKSVAQAELPQS